MKIGLFGTLAVLMWISLTPAAAQQAISTPILTSAENFRDIAGIAANRGGTGFANTTSNFGVMRTGVFYRSNVLSLSNADWITLSSLRIGRDIDLRTPGEISAAPDTVPAGAVYTNINVIGTANLPSPTLSTVTMDAVLSYGQSGYQTFVTNPVERSGFRTVLLTLAHDSGPDLFHCSLGKDRTGWTAVLLESIAGVSSATIMNDYLASNTTLAATISAETAALVAIAPELSGMNLNPLFGVDSSFLQAALDQANASYGSMYGYLMQGLGLSLEDIYVLRGKMVNYTLLPGQTAFGGNDASGASFLNALQNSSLSGNYTAYNYYLQSAVDTGTLGGVQRQIGGQVHADTASYLLRQPRWIDAALAPYADGLDLAQGQTRVWLAGLGGGFWSQGRSGISPSTEHSAGTLIGATLRPSEQASAYLGLGATAGTVESAAATATINTVLATLGGRYGFVSLETGPYVLARVDGGWVDSQSSRPLGGNLGTATGRVNGSVFSGLAGIGDVLRFDPATITPQLGFRVTNQTLGGFSESGSEVALDVHGQSNTTTSLLADLNLSLDPRQLGTWTIAPAVSLGYERVLGNPQVESTATRYGVAVSQKSAFDSCDLLKAGLGLTTRHDAFVIEAKANAIAGNASGSAGLSGQLSVGYRF
ncbi:autotransporter domain-containing protein [Desulfovibrio aerotolerans]|uniref:Autotransporter domain-containing protein n=1 Tax=Solidesulfovibrio aerotolerans TaxID=295255 RepID=A0A7C9INH6_9BACT|nr:tyrosine-protein phosphatase [Solidesulfovibrio aerotolerans]MYL84246.1 autotransporter domain-containing protein [Solidesulfovibrio aerotolerans]